MRETSNMQFYYTTLSTDIRKVISEFNKPLHFNIFFMNRIFLIDNSETISFDNNAWNYNPLQFCKDHYQEQHYHKIILLCNSLKSFFEFNVDNLPLGIIAPNVRDIIHVLSFDTVN